MVSSFAFLKKKKWGELSSVPIYVHPLLSSSPPSCPLSVSNPQISGWTFLISAQMPLLPTPLALKYDWSIQGQNHSGTAPGFICSAHFDLCWLREEDHEPYHLQALQLVQLGIYANIILASCRR